MKCEVCGSPFQPSRPNQKFCSLKCREKNKSRRRRGGVRLPIRTHCQGCEQPLPPQRKRGNPRKWCSSACRLKIYHRLHPRRLRRFRCQYCGKLVIAHSSEHKYCSTICRYAAWHRMATESPRPCPVCGDLFQPRVPQHRYCSAKCSQEMRNGRRRLGLRSQSPGNVRRHALKAGGVTMAELLASQQNKCPLCKRSLRGARLALDHILPRSVGGSDSRDNLQVVHFNCNLRKNCYGPDQLRLPLGLRFRTG